MSDGFVKTAAIYRRGGKVFMHPYSTSTQGLWIFTEPVFVATEFDRKLAGQLLAILAKSRENVPHPKSWAGLTAPLLKAAGARSYNAFANSAKCVEAVLDGDSVTLLPTKTEPGNGFAHLNHKVIRCRVNKDDLLQGLRAAFDACE
jgi:hypothetical protein